jgi:hypothetical protein
MSTTFQVGQRVTFTTPGRYPTQQTGAIQAIDSRFADVKCDDGKVRRARPATLHAA